MPFWCCGDAVSLLSLCARNAVYEALQTQETSTPAWSSINNATCLVRFPRIMDSFFRDEIRDAQTQWPLDYEVRYKRPAVHLDNFPRAPFSTPRYNASNCDALLTS